MEYKEAGRQLQKLRIRWCASRGHASRVAPSPARDINLLWTVSPGSKILPLQIMLNTLCSAATLGVAMPIGTLGIQGRIHRRRPHRAKSRDGSSNSDAAAAPSDSSMFSRTAETIRRQESRKITNDNRNKAT